MIVLQISVMRGTGFATTSRLFLVTFYCVFPIVGVTPASKTFDVCTSGVKFSVRKTAEAARISAGVLRSCNINQIGVLARARNVSFTGKPFFSSDASFAISRHIMIIISTLYLFCIASINASHCSGIPVSLRSLQTGL